MWVAVTDTYLTEAVRSMREGCAVCVSNQLGDSEQYIRSSVLTIKAVFLHQRKLHFKASLSYLLALFEKE